MLNWEQPESYEIKKMLIPFDDCKQKGSLMYTREVLDDLLTKKLLLEPGEKSLLEMLIDSWGIAPCVPDRGWKAVSSGDLLRLANFYYNCPMDFGVEL